MRSLGDQHGQPGHGTMKFCKDCRFAVKELDWKCQHPDAAQRELDLVTGENRINRNFCHYERQNGKCGWGAKNWQPIKASGGFV
jgi:hypothetical protein